MQFNKFELYTPEVKTIETPKTDARGNKYVEVVEVGPELGVNVLYIQDEKGNDWYKAQKSFKPETVKIAFDAEGIIRQIDTDASMMWPIGMSVAEIESLPDGCQVDGNWSYLNDTITRTGGSDIARATAYKKSLLNEAQIAMNPLIAAHVMGSATEEEAESLAAWKKYCDKVSAIDPEKAVTGISWPDHP